ncbi:nitroreductase family protein, partial [Kitasatospora sp. NPDC007106]|uniref:nitroreductase family protein n=1 Tax=Kitasatospora sp. NPDC007106 TaxID=3156914 RepID=UPI0033C3E0AD
MTDRRDGIGREFWRISLEDLAEAMETRQSEYGNPDEPLKFKIYRGLPRLPLTTRLPTELGPVDTLDGPGLSTLLHYGYGISRQEFDTNGTWPYHRTVASARCLFGVQLYVCLADGTHHYDAPHHTLVRLREGDHRRLLTRATGTGGPMPQAVVVLAALLPKTAYIYRDYAYRLCTQEAGLVAGNLDLVARAMGLRAHVHHQFLDEPVGKLLGLDGDEEPALLVLPLHLAEAEAEAGAGAGAGPGPGTGPKGRPVAETAAALAATVEAIEPPVVPSGLHVPRACPLLTEVNRASLRTDTTGFTTAVPVAPALPGAEPRPLPATEVPEPGLAGVLRARDSGPGIFRPVASRVDGVELWARLARIRTGIVSDAVPAGTPAPLEVFLTVGDLTGIPPGAYRIAPETGALHPVVRTAPHGAADAVAVGPDAVTAIERVTVPGPVFTHVNAVVHLVGDR